MYYTSGVCVCARVRARACAHVCDDQPSCFVQNWEVFPGLRTFSGTTGKVLIPSGTSWLLSGECESTGTDLYDVLLMAFDLGAEVRRKEII